MRILTIALIFSIITLIEISTLSCGGSNELPDYTNSETGVFLNENIYLAPLDEIPLSELESRKLTPSLPFSLFGLYCSQLFYCCDYETISMVLESSCDIGWIQPGETSDKYDISAQIYRVSKEHPLEGGEYSSEWVVYVMNDSTGKVEIAPKPEQSGYYMLHIKNKTSNAFNLSYNIRIH